MIFHKRKYFLFYLIAVILSTCIAAFIIYELINSYNYEISSAEIRNNGVATIIASRFAGTLREIDFIMQDINDHVTVEQLAFLNGANGRETTELNQLLSRKIASHPWLSGLGVMNQNGIFVGAVNRNRPQDVGADFSFREYFSYLYNNRNENSYFSPVFKETESDDIWLAFSRTLRLKQGQFDGVIFAGLTGQYIAEGLLGHINFAKGGSIALIDIEKGLLFQNPPIYGIVGHKVADPNLDAFILSGSESLTFIDFSPLDNKKKFITFQRADEFPYILVIASIIEVDLEDWYKKAIIYSFGWLFCTIILLLLTYSLRRLYLSNSILGEKNNELQNALKEIKTLRGIVPICSFCKQIRDDKGFWNQVETYVAKYTDAEFSHGICPDCMKKHYPNVYKPIDSGKNKE